MKQSNYAGVILAAGKSERFGAAKILADWHGEVLLRYITKKVLNVGLNSTVVVLGSVVGPAIEVLSDLPVEVVINHQFSLGIGASFSKGVSALPKSLAGAFLFLCDQPFFSKELIDAMIGVSDDVDVVVPTVNGSPGHPVLWKQQTFDRIRKMSHGETGRSIQKEINSLECPWHDGKILLDIDTQQDYDRLINYS